MDRTDITDGRTLPLPKVILEGGRRGYLAAVVAGAILGAFTLVPTILLSDRAAFAFLAVLLGMIGSVYLGFALTDGRAKIFQIEYVGLVLFLVLPVVALVQNLPVVLAAGYLGHAAWDIIHHPRAVTTTMPSWYVPVCIGYDVVVGAFVLLRFA
jgi:hypothetical protein